MREELGQKSLHESEQVALKALNCASESVLQELARPLNVECSVSEANRADTAARTQSANYAEEIDDIDDAVCLPFSAYEAHKTPSRQ